MAARLASVISGFMLVALTAGQAAAVAEGDLTVTLDPDTSEVGIETCAAYAASQISVQGAFASDGETDFELRLTVNTEGSSACVRDNSECNRDSACKCLAQVSNATSISSEFSLKELLGDDVCSSSTDQRLYFFLQYYREATVTGADDVSENGASVSVLVDLVAPGRPANAPTRVLNSESALVAEISGTDYFADGSEIAGLSICAVPVSDADSADSVYPDPALHRCITADVGPDATEKTQFRIESLTNGATYYVVYAEIDEAGNKGLYSPGTEGTPTEVKDFAEYYEEICGDSVGGDEGSISGNCEGGGCRSTDLPGSLPLLGLILLSGFGVRRRWRA